MVQIGMATRSQSENEVLHTEGGLCASYGENHMKIELSFPVEENVTAFASMGVNDNFVSYVEIDESHGLHTEVQKRVHHYDTPYGAMKGLMERYAGVNTTVSVETDETTIYFNGLTVEQMDWISVHSI